MTTAKRTKEIERLTSVEYVWKDSDVGTAKTLLRALNEQNTALYEACKAAVAERMLRDELAAIGARSREKHHTAESIMLDRTRKSEILATINENGRLLRAALAKADGGGE